MRTVIVRSSTIYRPILQRSNYSPLPVRPTKSRKLNHRNLKNQGSLDPSQLPSVTPQSNPNQPGSFWNLTPSSQSPKFPWTEYDSITNKTSIGTTSIPNSNGVRTENLSPIVVQVSKDPNGILKPDHPASRLLSQSALVIVRQLEMMNLFIGFEQANRYRILSPTGETVGFLAEEERGLSSTLFRQLAGTHRAFQASVMDSSGKEVLRIRRPFSFINSRIFIETGRPDGLAYYDDMRELDATENEIIGESQQEFHLWRRKYNLFTRRRSDRTNLNSTHDPEENDDRFDQFAKIDSGFLSWDFYTQDQYDRLMGSVTRNFTGFGREIFTDTGQYVIRFDGIESQIDLQDARLPSNEAQPHGLTLDQRAVLLATAVSIDFDYFSRTHRGGLMPPIFFGGGSSEE